MGCFTFVKLMMVVFNLLIFRIFRAESSWTLLSWMSSTGSPPAVECTCTAHQYYITAVNTGRGLSDHGDFNSESLRHTSRSLDNDLDLVQVHMRGQASTCSRWCTTTTSTTISRLLLNIGRHAGCIKAAEPDGGRRGGGREYGCRIMFNYQSRDGGRERREGRCGESGLVEVEVEVVRAAATDRLGGLTLLAMASGERGRGLLPAAAVAVFQSGHAVRQRGLLLHRGGGGAGAAGLLGCCGAHKRASACCSRWFFSIILIIFIAEVAAAVVALAYSSFAEGILRAWATPALQQDYGSEPVVTKIWNTTMTELKCCGFTNYTDFMGSSSSRRTEEASPPAAAGPTAPPAGRTRHNAAPCRAALNTSCRR
ncbi:hypothetical protein INR49_009064 [Caranx melampygus]|nr:hypothetical protein INR49_009064 [Caranx melampygus]